MFERIKRLYQEGRLDESGVWNAVERGWITNEQAVEIIEGGDITEDAADGE